MEFLAELRPWLRAFHIIAAIAFMAGMLYLPRLYVYHCQTEVGSRESELFKVMERRLLRGIINPAMFVLIALGVLLALTPGALDFSDGWVWVKLIGLFVMFGLHGVFSRWRREFEADQGRRSPRFYKLMNEVPTVLMIVIVIMAVVRPF
ncbi:MAG: protoporphyrinogen oxidase HemJ [Alphaproteobacteria bacterium]|nr:protoporphyrinogen oxidase HemJ [Alphaproteobacteria bacterium]